MQDHLTTFFKITSLLMLLSIDYFGVTATPFITKWKPAGTSFVIPTSGAGYNYDIYVYDPSNTIVSSATSVTGGYTASGLTAGTTYRVEILGSFPRMYFNDSGSKLDIIDITQWGDFAWKNFAYSFYGCSNMDITATDTPVLTNVKSLFRMFRACTSLNGSSSNWDWHTVTINNMSELFYDATNFNNKIGGWDVSNVTNMASMFRGASAFNQDINYNSGTGAWDVSSVTDMSSMLRGATDFNQDISGWKTHSIVDMNSMFRDAMNFNGDISAWDVSNVTNMTSMFFGASSFNIDISSWNTGNVLAMNSMFRNAGVFNRNLNTSGSDWDVSNVTNMSYMFSGAVAFNGDISNWDVSNVTNMSNMFSGASIFNRDISGWVVSNVTSMTTMFNNANAFDQNLGSWDLQNVTTMTAMLNSSNGGGLSCKNFGLTLKGWAANITTPSFITLGAGNRYLPNTVDKDWLINNKGWTFSGTDRGICTQTWLGTNSTDWADGTSWNLGFVPGNGAIINIDASAANLLKLDQDRVVATLNFNGANLNVVLGDYNLTVTTVNGADANNYIETNGTGHTFRSIANNTTFIFPVGNTYYNPVSIRNRTGSADIFSTRVLDEAYENGLSGSALNAGKTPHVKATWDISKASPNGGSGVNFVFTWDPAQETGPLATPTLNHYNSIMSLWEIASGTSSAGVNTVTLTGYTGSFSPFAIGWSSAIPLPVELAAFNAIPDHNKRIVKLSWITAQEVNNDRFEILRSTDGRNWENIGTVAGQGTSYQQTSYTFIDHNPADANYYRLNQIDYNGTATLSDIRFVHFQSTSAHPTTIYPNPTQGKLTINALQGDEYVITDLYGRVVAQGVLASDIVEINLADLNKGMYFVKVGEITQRIVLH
ncbi:MAG: BspA family leucine-rich repeat surface protein [Bacteroidia bacterium]|nr:BspA family leucine-rich repeat surface protein [Bacteroidia bacterium]